jgi:transaldolase
MNPIQQLRALGQSIWLDNITRDLITTGKLGRYLDEFAVTGLTSNPTIFDNAIGSTTSYDQDIQQKVKAGKRGEDLFFDLALRISREPPIFFDRSTTRQAASTAGCRWRYRHYSPMTRRGRFALPDSYTSGRRDRISSSRFPAPPRALPRSRSRSSPAYRSTSLFCFSRGQYVAAAEAYLRAIERRLAAGLSPRVHSVASVFISRWDIAVMGKVPEALRDRLGIAVAKQTYQAYRDLLASPRWRKLATAGVPTQRLLWASTGTKDPLASDVLYLNALAAADTINTVPEATLKAFADHGTIEGGLPLDGGDAAAVLAGFAGVGVDVATLANELQREGTQTFDAAWCDLLQRIVDKSDALAHAA